MPDPTDKPVPEEVLLQRLVTENQQIDQYIQLLNSQQITDAQQFQYNSSHSDTLTTVYHYMFVLYFVIVLVLCYVLFFKNKTNSVEFSGWRVSPPYTNSRNMKIGIVLLFVAFPFFIYPLEKKLWEFCVFLYRLIVKTPVGDHPIEVVKKDRGDVFVTA
jgi:hypothetical protein